MTSGFSSLLKEYPRCRRAVPSRSKAASTVNMGEPRLSLGPFYGQRRERVAPRLSVGACLVAGAVQGRKTSRWPPSWRSARAASSAAGPRSAPPGPRFSRVQEGRDLAGLEPRVEDLDRGGPILLAKRQAGEDRLLEGRGTGSARGLGETQAGGPAARARRPRSRCAPGRARRRSGGSSRPPPARRRPPAGPPSSDRSCPRAPCRAACRAATRPATARRRSGPPAWPAGSGSTLPMSLTRPKSRTLRKSGMPP